MATNPFEVLKKLSYNTKFIDTTDLKGGSINKDTLNTLKTLGISINKLSNEIALNLNVSYDRWQLYYEVTKSLDHWMMSAATELFADFATTYSPMNNATVWVTGESKYVEILTKFINDVGLEEKIFDWAYNVGAFGDLFIKVNGAPGLGVISIDDNRNPLEISRADYNGDLIGFYETPAGIMTGSSETNDRARLIAQQHQVTYDSPIDTEALVKDICDLKQAFTQYGGARPFGVSILFGGIDDEEPVLFLTDPTGIFFQYRATAIGESENEVKEILNKEYKETLSVDDGFKLAIKALKNVLGKEFDIKRVDGAYIITQEKKFIRLDQGYIKKTLKQ